MKTTEEKQVPRLSIALKLIIAYIIILLGDKIFV